ncbi:hypothetical protein BDQ12DRAFT_679818 [Crucibulum laeve]|uniref:Uncharacterized protein n=1 Tax=Crucibulum laeve TaxID=68775 RepID=A0A5C3M7L5_9AGAR|nr:hypothetical protein BDQ12DRAFT_679818 [Crucibulum laeve]
MPQMPYTPHHPHHQPPPHMFAPIPDPRAQFIITQAMHQLSALVAGGPWTSPQGMPHTPSRRHPHRGESMYSTPMHHPHPYQYMYDPDFSRATMPPESPEVLSSPAQPRERRKSLVRRSRSRGRRVSFRLEEGGMEWGREEGREEETDAIDMYSSPPSVGQERVKKEKGKARADDSPSKSSKKQDKGEEGKDKERRRLASGRHSPSPFPPRRTRPATRGQTPGPTIHQEPLASVEESRTQRKKTPSGKQPRRKQSIGTIVSGNG